MRANLIVVNSPGFGGRACLLNGEEQVFVEAFVTALAM